jgi:hypothetical protein
MADLFNTHDVRAHLAAAWESQRGANRSREYYDGFAAALRVLAISFKIAPGLVLPETEGGREDENRFKRLA